MRLTNNARETVKKNVEKVNKWERTNKKKENNWDEKKNATKNENRKRNIKNEHKE